MDVKCPHLFKNKTMPHISLHVFFEKELLMKYIFLNCYHISFDELWNYSMKKIDYVYIMI